MTRLLFPFLYPAAFIVLSIFWRNVSQVAGRLLDPKILAGLVLLYQGLRVLAAITLLSWAFVWLLQQRDFATLFIAGISWLCLLLVDLQKRPQKKDALKLAPEPSSPR